MPRFSTQQKFFQRGATHWFPVPFLSLPLLWLFLLHCLAVCVCFAPSVTACAFALFLSFVLHVCVCSPWPRSSASLSHGALSFHSLAHILPQRLQHRPGHTCPMEVPRCATIIALSSLPGRTYHQGFPSDRFFLWTGGGVHECGGKGELGASPFILPSEMSSVCESDLHRTGHIQTGRPTLALLRDSAQWMVLRKMH